MFSQINSRLTGFCSLFFVLALVFANSGFAEEAYRIGGDDTLNIKVYEQPDLSTSVRVSQDHGTIKYPLLGEVQVSGLTEEEAGDKIGDLLKSGGFLRAPQVALTVQEYRSQKIPIMGQVNKPGEYVLKGANRVVDLIAQAGGVKTDAADIIIVVKYVDGKPIRKQIDILKFYAGDMNQNIEVTEGDFILIPKMDTFYIHGEVKRPGSYRLERGMTAMQALSVGGGLSPRGSLKGMKVTRRKGEEITEEVRVTLTDRLKPDDVLYVKERLF